MGVYTLGKMDFRYKTLENGFWILKYIKSDLRTKSKKDIIIESLSH